MNDVKVKPARGKGRTKAPSPAPAPEARPAAKAARTVRKAKPAPVSEPALFDAPAQPAPKVPARAPAKAAAKAVAQPKAAVAVETPAAPPPPSLVETVVVPIAALSLSGDGPVPQALFNPMKAVLGTRDPRALYARAQETGDTLRNAMSESATATSRGLVELNSQMLDLVRAHSDATLSLWRSALAAGSMSEAIRVQTSGVRQVYEASAGHWKSIAETAGRTAEAAMRPMQSALKRG
ncbi:phasin family protein [Salinarimonas soli]|uniref:Phasin family protein n=1 Tax=Salinarimonas soli TaxID=1638099 RepID=A0A5B2VVC2_9HYPH|nr:phasin family protein [Salinarimonas soli]KAA2242207.1 phasin family protein [Salinarimonas soli]